MKNIKKTVSVILCICMMVCSLSFLASAKKVCDCDNLPIIYVKGRSDVYEDKYTRQVKLPSVSLDEVKDDIVPLLPTLADGFLSGDYTEYGKSIAGLFKKYYANFSPDEQGNLPGNSANHYDPAWYYRDIHRDVPHDNGQHCSDYLMGYLFEYDFRLSPWDIADDLYSFVTKIKEITGHDKINMVARCLGSCIASAYFAKYGWKDINTVVIYNPTNNGTIVTNAFFTGKLNVDVKAVDYFVNENVESDEFFIQFLLASLDMLSTFKGLNLTAAVLSAEVNKIAKCCAPECLRASYGTMNGYWAMVGPECYEEARSYVFPGEYAERYKNIIEKNDAYYYNVASKLPQIYKAMEADGVNMKFITKYGLSAYPVSSEATEQSDMIISLRQQTFGATSAEMGKTLSPLYRFTAKRNGTAKYISADNIVDCSTALFPDSTWVIKNFTHNDFPTVVDVMILRLLENGGKTTVWDIPEYPQYLLIDDESEVLTPLHKGNSAPEAKDTFVGKLMVYVLYLAEIMTKFLETINFFVPKA